MIKERENYLVNQRWFATNLVHFFMEEIENIWVVL